MIVTSRYLKVSEFKLFDTLSRRFVDKSACEQPYHVDVLDCYWTFGNYSIHEERSLFGKVKAVYHRVNKVTIGGVEIEPLDYIKSRVVINGDKPVVIQLDFNFVAEYLLDRRSRTLCYDAYIDDGSSSSHYDSQNNESFTPVLLDRLHGLRYNIIKPSDFVPGKDFDGFQWYSEQYSSVGLLEYDCNITIRFKHLSSVNHIFILGAYAVLFDASFNFLAVVALYQIAASADRFIEIHEVVYSASRAFDKEFIDLRSQADDDFDRFLGIQVGMDA